MQIHEIFRRRTNEGVLKGVTVAPNSAPGLGSAIAHNLAGKVLQKAGLPANLGDGSEQAGFGGARDAAANVNQPLIKQMAQQIQERFNLGVQQAMKKEGVRSSMELSANAKNTIGQSLKNYLHRTVMQNKVGVNYRELPKLVDALHRDEANRIVETIDELIHNLLDFGPPDLKPGDYLNLAKAAYDAMSLVQFYPSVSTKERQLGHSKLDNLFQQYKQAIGDPATSPAKIDDIKQQILASGGQNMMSQSLEQTAQQELPRLPVAQAPVAQAPVAQAPVAQAPAAETPEQRRRRLQALAQQNADRSATPVAASGPNFGKGTPMPMNPYQVPGARTTATPVKPATPAPAGTRVVSGGPTPAEREQLARRIAQASGTKV